MIFAWRKGRNRQRRSLAWHPPTRAASSHVLLLSHLFIRGSADLPKIRASRRTCEHSLSVEGNGTNDSNNNAAATCYTASPNGINLNHGVFYTVAFHLSQCTIHASHLICIRMACRKLGHGLYTAKVQQRAV